jgi:hypothetical protein
MDGGLPPIKAWPGCAGRWSRRPEWLPAECDWSEGEHRLRRFTSRDSQAALVAIPVFRECDSPGVAFCPASTGIAVLRIGSRRRPKMNQLAADHSVGASTASGRCQLSARQSRATRSVRHLAKRAPSRIVTFDRSWYKRAGVERVMGFAQRRRANYFLQLAPLGTRSTRVGVDLHNSRLQRAPLGGVP